MLKLVPVEQPGTNVTYRAENRGSTILKRGLWAGNKNRINFERKRSSMKVTVVIKGYKTT